jgi:hypothetical protein
MSSARFFSVSKVQNFRKTTAKLSSLSYTPEFCPLQISLLTSSSVRFLHSVGVLLTTPVDSLLPPLAVAGEGMTSLSELVCCCLLHPTAAPAL